VLPVPGVSEDQRVLQEDRVIWDHRVYLDLRGSREPLVPQVPLAHQERVYRWHLQPYVERSLLEFPGRRVPWALLDPREREERLAAADRREAEDHRDHQEAPGHRADRDCPAEQEIPESRAKRADREENTLKMTFVKFAHLCSETGYLS